jgi:hypothetical protein
MLHFEPSAQTSVSIKASFPSIHQTLVIKLAADLNLIDRLKPIRRQVQGTNHSMVCEIPEKEASALSEERVGGSEP